MIASGVRVRVGENAPFFKGETGIFDKIVGPDKNIVRIITNHKPLDYPWEVTTYICVKLEYVEVIDE